MTIKEIAFKLEELHKKSWMLNSLMLAVNDAIIYGPNSRNDFEGSLHALLSMTDEMMKDLEQITKASFDISYSVDKMQEIATELVNKEAV